jgi:SAM-dependent methyltransferase
MERTKKREWNDSGLFGISEQLYMENRKQFLSFFVKKSNPGRAAKMLDLGCMNGEFTLEIARAAGLDTMRAGGVKEDSIYGLEINKKYAADARRKGLTVKPADLNKRFPISSDSIDVVSANQVLEHVWNTDNFFRETNRVLRKGGYAVISVPNLSSLHSMLFIIMGQQPPTVHLIDKQVGNFLRGTDVSWPGHVKAFNIPALRDLAEIYGFRVERIEGFGVYFFPKPVQRLISKALGRYAIYLTVRIRKVKDYRPGK